MLHAELTTGKRPSASLGPMSQDKIHHNKKSRRFHYIPEWAAKRGLRQTDIVSEIGVDKSTVSRWFDGMVPSDPHLLALVSLFSLDEPTDLFRHPDDDWLFRLLRGRSAEERQRILAMIEAAFPRKAA